MSSRIPYSGKGEKNSVKPDLTKGSTSNDIAQCTIIKKIYGTVVELQFQRPIIIRPITLSKIFPTLPFAEITPAISHFIRAQRPSRSTTGGLKQK